MPGCRDSWETNLFSWDRRLTSFICTVAQRRDLAACVKRIYLHPRLLEPLDSHRDDGEFAVYAHIGCLDMDSNVKL
ncbi:hypothetical protein BJX62DRAFT_111042 [Aspergillus germanicus]